MIPYSVRRVGKLATVRRLVLVRLMVPMSGTVVPVAVQFTVMVAVMSVGKVENGT
jgi:hypothetical protein